MDNRYSIALLALFVVTLFGASASAQGVRGNRNGFQRINKGTFELSLDNLFLFNNTKVEVPDSDDFTSTFALTYTGGLTARYFVIPNLAVGASVNLLTAQTSQTVSTGGEETTTEASDFGFMGFGVADYYVRLSNSFFLKPGVGVGYFSATRERPGVEEGQVAETKLSGIAAKANLSLVFYVNQSFNLKAGIDLIYRGGEESDEAAAEGVEPVPFTTVEGGFAIGMGYNF